MLRISNPIEQIDPAGHFFDAVGGLRGVRVLAPFDDRVLQWPAGPRAQFPKSAGDRQDIVPPVGLVVLPLVSAAAVQSCDRLFAVAVYEGTGNVE